MSEPENGCLYCGGACVAWLHAGVRDYLGFVPGTWSFHGCGTCGAGLLVPFPSAADLPSFYPATYSFQRKRHGICRRILAGIEYQLFYKPTYRAQAAVAVKDVTRSAGRELRALDIGCGPGLRLLEFAKRGLKPCGLDFKTENVEYVTHVLRLPAVCADASQLATLFGAQDFDLVTAFYVMEHVTDVHALLSDCYRVLRPGGRIVVAVPLLDSLQARWFGSRWVNVIEAPRHLSLPSRRGIRVALERAGFRNVCIRPDALFAVAGTIALSVVPGGSCGSRHGWLGWKRLAAGFLTLCALPLAFVEGHILKRPGLAIVLADKPD